MALDLPAQACVTLDADHAGEFDAELIAPGSYLLEKLLTLATHRGRWEINRIIPGSDAWAEAALRSEPRLGSEAPIEILSRGDERLALFTFRTALTSDEKREAFHAVAVPLDGSEAWEVPWPIVEDGLTAETLPGFAPDLSAAYHRAQRFVAETMQAEMGSFQKSCLAALEEEVRRIFRYFDGTVAEIREAAPSGADDIVRAIESERDRRLAEALERFEPHAVASLCSVRVVTVPSVRASVRVDDSTRAEVRIDAFTRHARGLPERVTEVAYVRLRAHPPSGTPRSRRRAAGVSRRSPRGPTGQSRSAASRRPGP